MIIEIIQFNSLGTRWRHIGGRLKQVESGPNGVVWGVNRHNQIFFRAGVTRRNPVGRRWHYIRQGRLRHISVGCTGVYGLSTNGQIWKYRGGI